MAAAMLRGMAPLMETHFKVRLMDEAITEAVRLSARYISGRQLPDKAIGVLDTACAKVALGQAAVPAAMEDITKLLERLAAEIGALEREAAAGAPHEARLVELRTQRDVAQKDLAVLSTRYQQEKALVGEISALRAKLEAQPVDSTPKKPSKKAAAPTELQTKLQALTTLQGARLEAEVLSIAPQQAVAWNRRGMEPYAEPVELVDATIRRLGLGQQQMAAIERQRQRFLDGAEPIARLSVQTSRARVAPFPTGPFRFVALDVETANNDRGSICQIGVACVRSDNSIDTWVTFVDPKTDVWIWSGLHGITARTVRGVPTFKELLPMLEAALEGGIVYQHSGFDRSAISAACANAGISAPLWQWRDSVLVARTAWPELKGNGGHGLSSLKAHLGLEFNHHDAGEDARAAAEVVLHAEGARPIKAEYRAPRVEKRTIETDDFDLIEDCSEDTSVPVPTLSTSQPTPVNRTSRHIGTSQITQGNIDNAHIYLRGFFEKFPADAIGGSNKSEAARREISVDWGGETIVMTDLDGAKKFFRKRSWIRAFFEGNGIVAGDVVSVDETASFSYRVSLLRQAT